MMHLHIEVSVATRTTTSSVVWQFARMDWIKQSSSTITLLLQVLPGFGKEIARQSNGMTERIV
jgi:hypothetical protein